MNIGFVTCVHPLYYLPAVHRHQEDAIAGLRAAGANVIGPVVARDPKDIPAIVDELKKGNIDLLLFFFCTWVAEEITLSIAQELENISLLLWALPYFDLSIPMPSPMTGITTTGCNLSRIGRSFLHHVSAVTPEGIQAVVRVARNASVLGRLRRARFGVFGSACPGMLDTRCDDLLMQRKLGLTIKRFDLQTLLQARQASSHEEAMQMAQALKKRTGESTVTLETLAEQYRLYLGMRSLLQEHRLDGFSVRCWPELRDQHKTTICLTMAEMAEAGVATACEADPAALVTCYILSALTGQPGCTLEITAYLEEQSALQLAHCGLAALSLAGNPEHAKIRSHMRTGTGAMVEFGFKPGRVTLAKLLRPFEDALKMFVARGEVVPTEPGTRGSVATVRVEPSPAQFLQTMMQNAVEHHLVIVYGDCTEDLVQVARLAGIECIRPA